MESSKNRTSEFRFTSSYGVVSSLLIALLRSVGAVGNTQVTTEYLTLIKLNYISLNYYILHKTADHKIRIIF